MDQNFCLQLFILLIFWTPLLSKSTFNANILLNFEDLIQKVNDTIYLSHFYISGHSNSQSVAYIPYAVLPESSGEYNVLMQ